MNAIAIEIGPQVRPDRFSIATDEVNIWRSRCIDAFTKAEHAVTECLAAMAAHPSSCGEIDLPHLSGQRLEVLSQTLGSDHPFAIHAGKAREALECYRALTDTRNTLCHGVATITLDMRGRWTVVLRMASFCSRKLTRQTMAFDSIEAEAMRATISRTAQRLVAHLRNLQTYGADLATL